MLCFTPVVERYHRKRERVLVFMFSTAAFIPLYTQIQRVAP